MTTATGNIKIEMRVGDGSWQDVTGDFVTVQGGYIVKHSPIASSAGSNCFAVVGMEDSTFFAYFNRKAVKYLQRYRRRGERQKKGKL